MDQEKIGKFIAKKRKQKGITQREFAEKLGVTDKTVSRWENAHYLPDISLFHNICEILEIEVTELLEGESLKNDIGKEEVKETIMKIVDISSDEVKKKKEKTIKISIFIICMIIILFATLLWIVKNRKIEQKYKLGDLVPFPKQIAFKEKEDGWLCYFDIEYIQSNIEYPYYYGYNCENLKYEELYDFMPVGTDADENGIYEYKTTTNHPQYVYNRNYSADMRIINEYFNKYKFNTVISMEDLNELDLKYISKEDVLELYNEAIESPKIMKWGKNIITQKEVYLTKSLTKDNYTWIMGYMVKWGYIYYVNIELKIKDDYLSDLIKEDVATEEQKKIYQNIIAIEEYILEKQSFNLPKNLENKRPYSFLSENLSKIRHIED